MSQLAFPAIYYAAVLDSKGSLKMKMGTAPDQHIQQRIQGFLESSQGLPSFSLRLATAETALGMTLISESAWLVVVYSLAACVMMPKGSPQLEHLVAACSEMLKRHTGDQDLKELVERCSRPYRHQFPTFHENELQKVRENLNAWPKPSFRSLQLVRPVHGQSTTTDDPKFEINSDALDHLHRIFGDGSVPVSAVGTAGNIREGKSSLNNWIAERFTGHEGHDAAPLFSTSSGLRSHTRGLGIYFAHQSLSGEVGEGFKVFVDSEGLCDAAKDHSYGSKYDAKLFAILRFVVDVLIFNRKGTLDAGFLDNVTCLSYLVQLLGKSDQVTKIPLLMTLRDFSLIDGELDPQKYFGDMTCEIPADLGLDTEEQGRCQKVRAALNRFFSSIDVCTLRRPAAEETTLACLHEVPFCELRQEFQADFNAMYQVLRARLPSSGCSVSEWFQRVEAAVKCVNASQCSGACMTLLVSEGQAVRALDKAEQSLNDGQAVVKACFPMAEEDLQKLWQDTHQSSLDVLRQLCPPEDLPKQAEALSASWKRQEETLLAQNNLSSHEPLREWIEMAYSAQFRSLEDFQYPKGTAEEFEQMYKQVLDYFRKHAVGGKKAKELRAQTYEEDKKAMATALRSFNEVKAKQAAAQRTVEEAMRAREEEKKRIEADMQDLMQSHTGMLDKNESLKEMLKGESEKVDKAMADMRDMVSQHQEELRRIQAEHQEHVDRVRDNLKSQHDRALEQTKGALQRELDNVRNELQQTKNRANSLQGQIDNHKKKCKGEKGGCFPGSCHVAMADQSLVQMDQLQPGQQLAMDASMLGWYDHHPEEVHEFREIHHEHGVLVMTDNHLLQVAAPQGAETTQAGKVEVGMSLLTWKGIEFIPSRVHRISRGWHKGIYSPASTSGWLLVDGCWVSSYSKPSALQHVKLPDGRVHELCHSATAPLRGWWSLGHRLGWHFEAPRGESWAVKIMKRLAQVIL